MITKRLLPVFIVLLVATLACNLPAGGPPMVTAEREVSATSEVLVEVPITGATETLTSVPSPTATFTLTPTPTITLTPTSAVPTVSVSENTNCRTGPGVVYDLVGALLIG